VRKAGRPCCSREKNEVFVKRGDEGAVSGAGDWSEQVMCEKEKRSQGA